MNTHASSTAMLLTVSDLKTTFDTPRGLVTSVDGVSFSIAPGKTLGLVGESGSGKSVTSLSLMRLVERSNGRIAGGSMLFKSGNGEVDLKRLPEKEMRAVRGNEIAMVFQEPMTSLDPVWPVGKQIAEAVRLHQGASKVEARHRAIEMLRLVGIPAPEKRVDDYPHQMSGGMRQRVMIAIALSCRPSLLIADEPTTALDVTIQAQIIDLIKRLQGEIGMSVLFITHNMGVIAQVADDVAVMYAGQIVEHGPVRRIFSNPRHPYTIGLLNSIPRKGAVGRDGRLPAIGGIPPSPFDLPAGCRFASRCKFATDDCLRANPPFESVEADHIVRCLHWKEVAP
ncbi:ATP-binding cassette domain-containing protein [Agrobacterium vitis]|uniref:ATP-binding cassette domain-containing protein n=1 Tax=Agrobacterium vitis TaxID=373 RepID=A0ABD6G877_AGRVI|nr:ABC transporter ATP-binding protein [Agrobacterium vitis]MUO80857.1 ATP-binding cassette domain-containing protein [Agrobacterium vitis]MUO94765.1 ATP-binding cassette domain-containing protein [Agrobacterium vitis]MUP05473.1 ATP-binding cassette domain-containing protein [Agrobacterium vitis]MUZ81533.1 ATP-binding cassette domain-containing protein [Agrobacterium vitis]MVA92537.1 ATP-binding cassette domain-containing protein [Agrobacterium vitis]